MRLDVPWRSPRSGRPGRRVPSVISSEEAIVVAGPRVGGAGERRDAGAWSGRRTPTRSCRRSSRRVAAPPGCRRDVDGRASPAASPACAGRRAAASSSRRSRRPCRRRPRRPSGRRADVASQRPGTCGALAAVRPAGGTFSAIPRPRRATAGRGLGGVAAGRRRRVLATAAAAEGERGDDADDGDAAGDRRRNDPLRAAAGLAGGASGFGGFGGVAGSDCGIIVVRESARADRRGRGSDGLRRRGDRLRPGGGAGATASTGGGVSARLGGRRPRGRRRDVGLEGLRRLGSARAPARDLGGGRAGVGASTRRLGRRRPAGQRVGGRRAGRAGRT